MIDLAALDARIVAIVEQHARPMFVTQRNVLAVLGLPPLEYMYHARRGAFPSSKVRRLVTAKTSDVAFFLESRARRKPVKPIAKDLSPLDAALARAGGRVAK